MYLLQGGCSLDGAMDNPYRVEAIVNERKGCSESSRGSQPRQGIPGWLLQGYDTQLKPFITFVFHFHLTSHPLMHI